MKQIPVEIGRVVASKCGRDQGRTFLVIGEIDADFVWISDGKTHPIEKPKKKRRRHLKPTQTLHPELRKSILEGKYPENFELRAILSKEEG